MIFMENYSVFYKREELFPVLGIPRFFKRYKFFELNTDELHSDNRDVAQREDKLGFGASLLVIYNCEILTLLGMAGYAAWQGLEVLLNQM